MIDDDTISHVSKLKDACKDYLAEQEQERTTAQEYYRGEMNDMPSDEGRSSVASQDVRAVMKKVLPSIKRTILKSDTMVEYAPVGPGDEEGAEQASEYVNHVVVPESNVKRAIYDAIHDACIVKTGILKWGAYQCRKAMVYDFTDQPDEAVIGLFDDPEVEILEHEKEPETDPMVLEMDPNAKRHSFKLKRVEQDTKIRLEAVPRERFLITPGAESIEDAEIVGEERLVRRTDLVSEGYDKDSVWRVSAWSEDTETDDQSRMGKDWTDQKAESRKALEEVAIWEVYVKLDSDEDGIAELHRIVFGDGSDDDSGKGSHVILGHEIVSEAPYADIVIERDAHQFEGHSIYEDVRDVQRVKTAIQRAIQDNSYQVRDPRPIVDYSAVEDPDDVAATEHGKPIMLKPGRNPNDVISWSVTPFVGDKLFPMLEYWDGVSRDRTGITDASAGLDASQVQNVNTGVAALLSESGVAEADDRITSVAEGLKKAFKGLLKLVIAHADRERTVLVRGEWNTYDPRVWNVDMDATVNVGLGGGTKERDLAVLQMILGLQKDILASMGPAVGQMFVSAEQLGHTLSKIVETAGFPTAEPFFSQPEEKKVQQAIQEASEGADPDIEKAKMQAQTALQVEQMKQETNRQREAAQAEADLRVAAAQREFDSQKWAEEVALRREDAVMRERLELAKIRADLEKATIQAETTLKTSQQEPRSKDYAEGGLQ